MYMHVNITIDYYATLKMKALLLFVIYSKIIWAQRARDMETEGKPGESLKIQLCHPVRYSGLKQEDDKFKVGLEGNRNNT